MKSQKKLALVGGGKLNAIVARAFADGLLPDYELVGVLSRTYASAEAVANIAGCAVCRTLEELLALKPDYVAESASVQTIRDIATPVLSSGADLIALSCGAFAEEAFLEQVKSCADAHGTHVHIPSGAIGGFDVMQTVILMAQAGALPGTVSFSALKSPGGVYGTPLEAKSSEQEKANVFSGSAAEAIALLPTKVNVAVATALATLGPQKTAVSITTDPAFHGDEHVIQVETEGYRTRLDIYSATSDIAGWSVVALLRNLSSPITFH